MRAQKNHRHSGTFLSPKNKLHKPMQSRSNADSTLVTRVRFDCLHAWSKCCIQSLLSLHVPLFHVRYVHVHSRTYYITDLSRRGVFFLLFLLSHLNPPRTLRKVHHQHYSHPHPSSSACPVAWNRLSHTRKKYTQTHISQTYIHRKEKLQQPTHTHTRQIKHHVHHAAEPTDPYQFPEGG